MTNLFFDGFAAALTSLAAIIVAVTSSVPADGAALQAVDSPLTTVLGLNGRPSFLLLVLSEEEATMVDFFFFFIPMTRPPDFFIVVCVDYTVEGQGY